MKTIRIKNLFVDTNDLLESNIFLPLSQNEKRFDIL